MPAHLCQESPPTLGHADFYGHFCAKRLAPPLPNAVVGVRGLGPGDRILVRPDYKILYQVAWWANPAVSLSVAGFLPQLKSRVVHLMCDNAVVVSYIIKEGGTKSFRLTCLTIWLLKFCKRKGIRLVPVHLSGSCSIQADALSWVGQTLVTEWAINRQLLHSRQSSPHGEHQWPICSPSPSPDPRANYVDAMSILWSRMGMVYAFLSFQVVLAVQPDRQFPQPDSDLGSSTPDVTIMDAGATRAVLLSSHTTGRAATSHSRSVAAWTSHWDKDLRILESTHLTDLSVVDHFTPWEPPWKVPHHNAPRGSDGEKIPSNMLKFQ